MAVHYKSSVISSVIQDKALGTLVDYQKPMNNPTAIYVAVTNTPTLTYNVEGTLDNPSDTTITPTWFALPGGSALTASVTIKNDLPVMAIRLNVTAWSAGNIQMWLLQGDGA